MLVYTGLMNISAEDAAEFEEVLGEYCRWVKENEPDTIYYAGHKSTDDPESYLVIEIYRDEAAFEEHKKSDQMKKALGKVGPLIKGKTVVKRYESF